MRKWLSPTIGGNVLLWLVGAAMQLGGWVSHSIAISLLALAFLWSIAFLIYWLRNRHHERQTQPNKKNIDEVSKALERLSQEEKEFLITHKDGLISGYEDFPISETETKILHHLYLLGIIDREQRLMPSPSLHPYNVTYWRLTERGKKILNELSKI